MRKSEIHIMTKEGRQPVAGLVSTTFGMHSYGSGHMVTHLPTGLSLHRFALQKQARMFISRLESDSWPTPWESISGNAESVRANSSQAWELIHEVKENGQLSKSLKA